MATLTSKGRITIPKPIRDYLIIRAGQWLEFWIDAAGCVIMQPRNRDVRDLKGIVRSSRRHRAKLRPSINGLPTTRQSG
jgi:AbrB family looped-hinge helix DNA binding protein